MLEYFEDMRKGQDTDLAANTLDHLNYSKNCKALKKLHVFDRKLGIYS